MNIRLRHDAIVRILRRNGTATINELAEEIGASRRTVLRDIGALRDQGFVIHSESGRGGGLQLAPPVSNSPNSAGCSSSDTTAVYPNMHPGMPKGVGIKIAKQWIVEYMFSTVVEIASRGHAKHQKEMSDYNRIEN